MSREVMANYRLKAEECRQQAERSTLSTDKAHWLRLAEDWQTLAESVEQAESRWTPSFVKNSDAKRSQREARTCVMASPGTGVISALPLS